MPKYMTIAKCEKCHKRFETKDALRKHVKVCGSGDQKHIQILKDGEYPCKACSKVLPNKSSFKSHIFYGHGEKEIERCHGMSLKKFVGMSFLKKNRKTMLGSLKRGELDHKIFKDFRFNDETIEAVTKATQSIELETNQKF